MINITKTQTPTINIIHLLHVTLLNIILRATLLAIFHNPSVHRKIPIAHPLNDG